MDLFSSPSREHASWTCAAIVGNVTWTCLTKVGNIPQTNVCPCIWMWFPSRRWNNLEVLGLVPKKKGGNSTNGASSLATSCKFRTRREKPYGSSLYPMSRFEKISRALLESQSLGEIVNTTAPGTSFSQSQVNQALWLTAPGHI